MSQVRITDERLEAEFKKSTDTVMVHGKDGRIMGMYTPIDRTAILPRISEEELNQRMEDKTAKCFTTDEVLAKLRAL